MPSNAKARSNDDGFFRPRPRIQPSNLRNTPLYQPVSHRRQTQIQLRPEPVPSGHATTFKQPPAVSSSPSCLAYPERASNFTPAPRFAPAASDINSQFRPYSFASGACNSRWLIQLVARHRNRAAVSSWCCLGRPLLER
jgi:hypothetical protein